MLANFILFNHSSNKSNLVKPRGHIGSLTEIRENYQNPNPYPPSRPFIYKLADTLEKVHILKIFSSVKTGRPKKCECCIQLVKSYSFALQLLFVIARNRTREKLLGHYMSDFSSRIYHILFGFFLFSVLHANRTQDH